MTGRYRMPTSDEKTAGESLLGAVTAALECAPGQRRLPPGQPHAPVPGAARVAVTDKSRVRPVMSEASAEDLGGRGLALVDALSQQWGTDPLPWGKRVWADVDPANDFAPATSDDDRRLFATPVAQIVYVLIVLALAAWLAVFIVEGTP